MQFSRKKSGILKIDCRGISKFLGELEAEVMEIVWKIKEATVKTVQAQLEKEGKCLAYTTVLTVMQNLEKKGLLKSKRIEKKNLYTPTISKEEFLDKMVGDAVRSLVKDFPEQVVSHLFGGEDVDEEEIRKLLRILKERRRS
jgi:predicted transcriptional regulator